MCIVCKRGIIANVLQSWLDFHEQDCGKDGVQITDASHIMSPPVWPTRGQIENWIKVLREQN